MMWIEGGVTRSIWYCFLVMYVERLSFTLLNLQAGAFMSRIFTGVQGPG